MAKNQLISWDALPVGKAPQPVPLDHFPNTLHAVVWRNWDVIPLTKLAEVLRASPEAIQELAFSMGLREQRPILPVETRRNYMTILHRNWHLLPYEQLGALLDWTPSRFQFGLNEDDFMWVKLGSYKPTCPPVYHSPPDISSRTRAAEIAAILAEELGDEWNAPAEPPFEFLQRFRKGQIRSLPSSHQIRMVYPYFLRYGDPLIGEGVEDIPEGYLNELAESGVNAIWLQGILNTLAPWDLAPQLSEHWEERLANLRKLVERAGRSGIRVFLYLNEPRAMPRAFFEHYPELRGVEEMPSRAAYAPDVVALCTSTPAVKDFIVHSVRHVFEQVHDLGGILSLTYSENLTNCYSRTYPEKARDGSGLHHAFDPTSTNPRNREQKPCPRCIEHGPEVINAEVCSLLMRGMREANSDGQLLHYLWSTPEEWIPGVMDRLPSESWVLCVSEWGMPFSRGDYQGQVNEYSISVVGPSEQSLRQWHLAHARHLRTGAMVQAARSHELSSIPYIPALRLVGQHVANLLKAGIEGLMLGWTAGGSPSPNLRVPDLAGK